MYDDDQRRRANPVQFDYLVEGACLPDSEALMLGRHRKHLEQRVARLEALLDTPRDWSQLPPPSTVPLPDMPSSPDYSVNSGYLDDEWRRADQAYGYL